MYQSRYEELPVNGLHPAAGNPRVHDDAQISALAASITNWGVVKPIVVTDGGEIVCGEAVWRAARFVARETIRCIVLDGWPVAQVRALRVADNQLGLRSGWHEGLLSDTLRDLQAQGFDLDLVGFDRAYTSRLLAETEAEIATLAANDVRRPAARKTKTTGTAASETEHAVPLANAVLAFGPIRFNVERETFVAWFEELRQSAGFTPAAIEAEVRRRLSLPQ